MRALAMTLAMLAASVAHADEDNSQRAGGGALCGRDVRHHGAAIDLDVKDADLHDVFRLIADAAHVNVVVPDAVAGKLTLHLRRVAWDAVACAVARLHHLAITVDGNILVVTPAR